MSNTPPDRPPTLTVIAVTSASQTYALEEVARSVSLHPDLVRHYCQIGLLGPAYVADPDRPFDDDALYWLRRIERTRREHALDRAVLPLLCDLWHDIERLEAEVRALRGR